MNYHRPKAGVYCAALEAGLKDEAASWAINLSTHRIEMVTIDPLDLEAALDRDAAVHAVHPIRGIRTAPARR
jgi:hypothetical protein